MNWEEPDESMLTCAWAAGKVAGGVIVNGRRPTSPW